MTKDSENTEIKRPVTVSDLARDLNLSVSTVSRAFYPNAPIAPHTRAAVLEYAKKVGYRTNLFAKNLVTQSTQIVGVVAADLTNPYYPEVVSKLTALLQESGINVMLSTAVEPQKIDESVDILLNYRPNAIIILAANSVTAARERCDQAGIPCIFFNRLSSDGRGYGISCDNWRGGVMAANYFIKLGHKRLGYVSAFPDTSTNQDRKGGFLFQAKKAGLATPYIFDAGAFSYKNGFKAALEYKAIGSPPTAVFCANDILAIGFMEGLEANCGVNVPQDVSIIGFDDIEMASWPSHNLTTIAQPTDKMLERTVEIVKKISFKKNTFIPISKTIFIHPGPVIIRDTATSPKDSTL